ncbi:hypothetical protein ASPVEDRAFT_82276 [Aspergillus versicolor CBS 583.65]|uniref:Galactosyl transferase GMA12/MNN10 family protein n=1 Tax=Aspergillus versicolor CBS 583.65 TaxID=1036611 RepID=A0A1L9PGR2_ASPVE|nr:uncharacterized protein ASPVEDRAFT_82276 [Aspergillus versicolor CBS 583.65]OJJ00717.1 hypothetical protein ASPVEDRAFT_82276 [Aspergillus versicolor CBS 583.65]
MSRTRRPIRLKPVVQVVIALLGLFSLLNLFAKYPHVQSNNALPTVGKVMMIYGDNPVYRRAVETHRDHCDRLGYPLFLLQTEILDGVWNKLAYLSSLIVQELEKPEKERLEWLFWIDSDSILMNPNMRLETFLPPAHLSDVHIVLTKDWNGMNAGVFPIRVHPWSIKLLSAAIALPILKPGIKLFWEEQSALVSVLEKEYFAQSAVYVPLRWFNAYMRSADGESLNPDSVEDLQVHPGDLLVHFPGTPRDRFNETLSPYLAIAEQHRSDWELPVEETVYPAETADFWRKYALERGIESPIIEYIEEPLYE